MWTAAMKLVADRSYRVALRRKSSRRPKALSRQPRRQIEGATSATGSCCGGRGLPVGHGLCPEGAQGAAGDKVTLKVEGVVDGGMKRDEALGGTH